MCLLHLNGISTGFSFEAFCAPFFCVIRICTEFFSTILSFYSSSQFFRASSTFDVFEAGLWSLENISFGQQRLRDIRSRTSVPRAIPFGPAVPSRYSKQDFGLSKLSLSASSAFEIFEVGFRSLELSFSGQQRLRGIRSRTSVPRVISFGLAAPSRRLRQVSDLSSCFFRLNNTFRDLGSNFGPLNHLVLTCLPSYQRSSINMPEFWWHYTSSDAVCQIRR
jgi:hypothetical protein